MPKVGMEPIRRAQIIQAARRCLATLGSDRMTVRTVAQLAGLSSGSVVYYFGSMENLLISALLDVSDEFGRAYQEAVSRAASPREALEGLVEASLPSCPRTREMWSVWIEFLSQAARNPQLHQTAEVVYREWRERLAGVIAAGIQNGQFRPVEPMPVAKQLVGLIDGLALSCIFNDAGMPPEEMRALCFRFTAEVLLP